MRNRGGRSRARGLRAKSLLLRYEEEGGFSRPKPAYR